METPDQISEVLYDPAYAEVAVVSVLDQLGIGIYQEDGTPIRTAEERSDSDLFLFDPEVRGLIDMLLDDTADAWIEFRDFHAALAGLGFQGTAEELADAYTQSYAAEPDAAISQFVGYIDVDAPINRFSAWLLFVDGFVPESGGQAFASIDTAAFWPGVAAGQRSHRVARQRVQQAAKAPPNVDPLLVAHIMAIANNGSIRAWVDPNFAHEGHSGPGPVVTARLQLTARASAFYSPFSGGPIVPVSSVPAGVPINWEFDDVFYDHADVITSVSSFETDALGEAKFGWQIHAEKGDHTGYVTSTSGFAVATVQASDVINALYGVPAGLGALVKKELRSPGAQLEVQWHEPEAMVIDLKNHYDVSINVGLGDTAGVGDDEFAGILAKQDDGTWQGIVVGTAVGQQDSQFLGKPCTSRWNATQKVLVVAGDDPGAQFGDFTFTFYPVTDPAGSTGRGKCPPARWRQNGVSYAPYNDYNIHQPDAGVGVTVVLPQKPGGHVRVPVPAIPGSGFVIHDAYWDIDIQFLGSP